MKNCPGTTLTGSLLMPQKALELRFIEADIREELLDEGKPPSDSQLSKVDFTRLHDNQEASPGGVTLSEYTFPYLTRLARFTEERSASIRLCARIGWDHFDIWRPLLMYAGTRDLFRWTVRGKTDASGWPLSYLTLSAKPEPPIACGPLRDKHPRWPYKSWLSPFGHHFRTGVLN
ncbi:uncharacterized protein LACBIDRAFT_325457 [Laccaria bicolor S238N-H82]|uniref:Predicted protein n=1 Tax=Laccaria bicolor (strain S238N-H82 / ATCC MYA-4686) TaxID=486041 RepID=B0D4Z6_LACBS|nr:uncharacterized protein LACBIDRAFT_325457 [Laccaria bicolor S238N-H82]EDR10650.1 predicted protein [Laccaria bicolor S238N-H82]|eukprot:XP_001879100.1 predicted protein [Laccaria bicolor S238N-H82]